MRKKALECFLLKEKQAPKTPLSQKTNVDEKDAALTALNSSFVSLDQLSVYIASMRYPSR